MSIQFRYAARSDVGLVRKSNQDSGYAGPHLLVLADGMGGPAGGDIASSVALAHLAPLDEDAHGADDLLDLLRSALTGAHEELFERSQADASLEGLGTTCIALLRSGSKIAMVHIGDSRAYLLRDGALTQVTRDHSFVQYLVESGMLEPEAAQHHPQRSVLLRVLGDSAGELVLDESVRSALVGDRWLLCSDGLSGPVSAQTIQEVLSTVTDPGQCAENLVQLALRAGGPDNVTCVVADVVSGSEELPTTAAQIVGAAAKHRAKPSTAQVSPAQKAAALTAPPPEMAPAPDEDIDPRRITTGAKVRLALGSLIIFALITAGIYFGYAWTQTQYYVGIKDAKVMIYRGIPQSLGPIHLSQVVEETSLRASDLTEVVRQRALDPVLRSSLGQARALVADWKRLSQEARAKNASALPPNSPDAKSGPGE